MPEQPPTLRDMIQEALDSGVTYRELEARAIDPATGRTASRSVFFDTIGGKLDRMPYEYHLRGVAAALRVPYESVRQAAITQWLPADAETSGADSDAERLKMIEEVRRIRADFDRALARLYRWEHREKQRGTA